MIFHHVEDWDQAYTNGAHIARGDRWPEAWVEPARLYREKATAEGMARLDLSYGGHPRNRYDLFLPPSEPAGLVVFVHGGYWMRLDKSYWSHLASGSLAHGHAVAMPSYPLCPEVTIGEIVGHVATAIEHAARKIGGPIRLAGHSAGGHLVTRMICRDSALSPDVLSRIACTVSISGVHDLRPLLETEMNATLGLDEAEAAAQSPALLRPIDGVRLACWVGAGERNEFVRQSALLANAWTGLGAATLAHAEPDRHHFDVIDGLADPDHALTRTLMSG